MNSALYRSCRFASQVYNRRIFNVVQRNLADESTSKSKLVQLLQTIPKEKINDRDGRGWTALMLAAKEGDVNAVDLLLEKGSETGLRTASGHTAYDIATYWRREECAKHLKPAFLARDQENFFAFAGLQRHSNHREDAKWVQDIVTKDATQFILLHRAKPIVGYGGATSLKAKQATRPSLLVKSYPEVHHLINEDLGNLTYLGAWARGDAADRRPGTKHVDQNIFAVDVSEHEENYLVKELYRGCDVLAPFPGLLRLSEEDAGLVAQARPILDWQTRYRFCPTCGSETKLKDSGYKRTCSNKACSTHKEESNTNHPRLDPTVISAVLSRDNEYCLLGRQKHFPNGMYSCLAGFVEPGESIEQACRREVFEEVGIHASKVTYHSSQPWPMPSTLMLGCTTYADHDRNIKLDSGELEDAQWFTRMDVVLMLMQLHPEGFFLPPRQALAHRLVNDWMVKTAFD